MRAHVRKMFTFLSIPWTYLRNPPRASLAQSHTHRCHSFRGRASPAQRRTHRCHSLRRRAQHERGGQPQHPPPFTPQHPVPPRVRAGAVRMIAAVNFHNETCSRRSEVRNEAPSNDNLTPKRHAELPRGEQTPKRRLRRRGRAAHDASAFFELTTTSEAGNRLLHDNLRAPGLLAGYANPGAPKGVPFGLRIRDARGADEVRVRPRWAGSRREATKRGTERAPQAESASKPGATCGESAVPTTPMSS